jgi:hypothetical protein
VRPGLFHPDIRNITIALMVVWNVMNVIFYGTAFGIEEQHLTSSHHWNVAIVALSELPAYVLTALLMSSVGRKPLLWVPPTLHPPPSPLRIGNFLAIAVCTAVAAILKPHSDMGKVLVVAAHFFAASAFTLVRIYTWCPSRPHPPPSEIYPTHIPPPAHGAMKSISCLGAIASPWIGSFMVKQMRDPADPTSDPGNQLSMGLYCLFSALSVGCDRAAPCTAQGGLCFLLADTTGFPLPETFKDVRDIIRCRAGRAGSLAPRHQKPLLSLVPAGWEPLPPAHRHAEDTHALALQSP